MAIYINRLMGGDITIGTGGGSSEHPETRVKYTQASGLPDATFNIEGELTSSSINNISNVEEVDIGNIVTSILKGAFEECSSLTSVTIPNSVTSIGGSAFSYCSSLTSVTIGNGVTSIGGSAFYGCSGLANVTIPDSVTDIGFDAFSGCSGITTVTIVANGGNAANVKQAMIDAGVSSSITWNMPS